MMKNTDYTSKRRKINVNSLIKHDYKIKLEAHKTTHKKSRTTNMHTCNATAKNNNNKK